MVLWKLDMAFGAGDSRSISSMGVSAKTGQPTWCVTDVLQLNNLKIGCLTAINQMTEFNQTPESHDVLGPTGVCIRSRLIL